MRSLTTRLIIVIASILIAVIIGMQVYWLNKTYSFEKNEFNTSVLKAIRGVYEDLPLLYNVSAPLTDLVERPDANTFLFRIDSIPQKDSLLEHVSSELEDFHVFTDYKVTMLQKRSFNYVSLYFPSRSKYIISEMRTWIYSSAVLLVLLIAFSLSIYYFMKQKFLVEIQKDFINNVTHEFSTPLSVIDLSVEGLERHAYASNPEKHDRYVASIRYQSTYLKSHITNLINTVVAGQYHLATKKQALIPNELLKKTVLQLEPLLTKKGGTVKWELEQENKKIMGDEENLYLAFFNIINNAIKYSQHPEVTIATEAEEKKYMISIKDRGPGIAPSQRKKIFRKFYRAQNGNLHNSKGLGLGLYFTRKVVDGHRGTIDVNSIPGLGTEFVIELPLNHESNGKQGKDTAG